MEKKQKYTKEVYQAAKRRERGGDGDHTLSDNSVVIL